MSDEEIVEIEVEVPVEIPVSIPVAFTPGGSLRPTGEEGVHLRRKPQRSFADEGILINILHDPASESEGDANDDESGEEEYEPNHMARMRHLAQKIRHVAIYAEENDVDEEVAVEVLDVLDDAELPNPEINEEAEEEASTSLGRSRSRARGESRVRGRSRARGGIRARGGSRVRGGSRARDEGRADNGSGNRRADVPLPADSEFIWSDDFSSFTGHQEEYSRDPGPEVHYTEAIDLFLHVWDRSIVEQIVHHVNLYALQVIDAHVEADIPLGQHLDAWKQTDVDEIYRLFAIINYMALDYRARVSEYWSMGVLEMPDFRRLMSLNRFIILMRFLHFIDNTDDDRHLTSHERKIAKIRPIIDHCNKTCVYGRAAYHGCSA